MALKMKAAPAPCTTQRTSRRAAVVVQAQAERTSALPLAAAAFAAAGLLLTPSANAGVVFQAQPETKKLFQSSGAPAAPVERPFRVPGSTATASAPAPKAEAPKPKASESSSEAGLDPRAIALPASIAAIAGLGLAASKVDAGFSEWLNESGAFVRNSGAYAGFEEDIKDGNYLQPARARAGTTKVGTKKTGKK